MDILKFLCLTFILQLGYIQIKGNFNDCQTKEECGQCIISTSPQCAWCEDIYYNDTLKNYFKKCDLLENHKKQNCKKITNPLSSSKIDKAAQLEGETRVSPQAITVKLRPGQAVSIDIEVKTPKNFPIDLYYLMDMSSSIKKDLENIIGLGESLANELKFVTENFRLGFGGCVDKDIGPYTLFWDDEVTAKIMNNDVQRTFLFKNLSPLDDDTTKFGKAVSNTKISYNVDRPEASLEALLQVVVCENEIGWRNKKKARRIVILTTDATFHFAGDGLLGGFVLPNDGSCHLVNNNYTGWDKFDYPSLSQIRAIMAEHEIVPIFATTGNTDLYDKVASFFGQASGAVAARLNNDSSNIVPLIKDAYSKIAKVVNIRADPPKGVEIKFSAKCSKGKLALDQDFCDDVTIGEQVTFTAELKTNDCSNVKKNLDFLIKTNFDDVNVTLELICECPCGDPIINSKDCSYRGNLSCGICFCDKKLFAGRFCQCTKEEANDQTACRVPGAEAVCSGKGDCECGECICNKGTLNNFGEVDHIYGDQCQCSNTTCGRSNGGKLCGGPERGKCDCGKCLCNINWQGSACEEQCDKSTSMCLNNDGVECNGKGNCECNSCVCNSGYIGELCQECVSNCPDACQDYRECVKCRVFETSDLNKEQCATECAKWNISSHVLEPRVPEERRCIVRDEDDCSFVFSYHKDNVTGEIHLLVQRERICPAEPDILAIILGVIAGIVGIGLALLLIWKLLATIQDRREFARFDKETKNAKWNTGENPIFKQATSTFQNPMYGNQPQETTEEHLS